MNSVHPAFIGFALIVIVFIYTIHLVRSGRLSAHLAITWVAAELLLMVVMAIAGIRTYTIELLGGEAAPYSLFLIGAVWVVFLMLESLTRISTLTSKVKDITQELALTKEHFARLEKQVQKEHDLAER
jgi:hypothetical protein